MTLWDRTFDDVSEMYPEISTNTLLIDAACMDFIRRPEEFDVVVASNLFGDILTDIGAMITGSLGLASSGNINPDKDHPSMFEPTHGSAPDIAGKGIANEKSFRESVFLACEIYKKREEFHLLNENPLKIKSKK